MDTPRDRLLARFSQVRATTERLAAPLSPEDQQLQSMPACSPTKWHRAHTTWFFETFVLGPLGVSPVDPRYAYLFNSYYDAVGPRHPRPQRGLLSRPSVGEIAGYRRQVDARVLEHVGRADEAAFARVAPDLALGIAHEEQHQELLLTDVLHALHENPLRPAYRPARAGAAPPAPAPAPSDAAAPRAWVEYPGGVVEVGAPGGDGFCFDNETPRHRACVTPFALATRLCTVGEVKAFIAAKGYETPSLWLSDGLEHVRAHDLRAPLYARLEGGAYVVFTLDGERLAHDDEPAAHLSFYEADAIARFLAARLPTEQEWELAARSQAVEGNLLESGALAPRPAPPARAPAQLFGDAWEWTRSSYEPYPGFGAPAGALGEYNAKFMVNQRVLRGGSCFTPGAHIRASYRNFWPPETRFQVTGVRLARDVGDGDARTGRRP